MWQQILSRSILRHITAVDVHSYLIPCEHNTSELISIKMSTSTRTSLTQAWHCQKEEKKNFRLIDNIVEEWRWSNDTTAHFSFFDKLFIVPSAMAILLSSPQHIIRVNIIVDGLRSWYTHEFMQYMQNADGFFRTQGVVNGTLIGQCQVLIFIFIFSFLSLARSSSIHCRYTIFLS